MPRVSEIEGDTELQSEVLEDLVEARNYRRWLVDQALPHLGNNPLEIGSGLGHYAADWAASGVPRLTTSEADSDRLVQLRSRFANSSVVSVRELSIPISENAEYSAVVAYNLLEHIPDDRAALRAFGQLLRPGGCIVLVVPAFPSAMGEFDRAIGHQRRYRLKDLRRIAEQAGFSVETLRYVNCVGLLAWYVVVKGLKGRPKGGVVLTIYDRAVVPWLRKAESRWAPPFGQSLFLVARKS